MTARPPLAPGDDGSANRYPSRLCGMSYAGYGACIKPQAHDGLCEDAHRYLFTGRPDTATYGVSTPSTPASVIEALDTPFDPFQSRSVAEDDSYAVHVLVDGVALSVPMVIHAGRDYVPGEYLTSVCRRLGVRLMDYTPRIAEHTVIVSLAEIPGDDCSGDYSPVELAAATTVRSSVV